MFDCLGDNAICNSYDDPKIIVYNPVLNQPIAHRPMLAQRVRCTKSYCKIKISF